MGAVATFIVRVWLPDRPGALGGVASRIGAVRGDVIGIEILERGGGRAVDELVVELPDPDLVPLLVAEIAQVDGVDVEDVRPAYGGDGDGRLEAVEMAALLVGMPEPSSLVTALLAQARAHFAADWAAAVGVDDLSGSAVLTASEGFPPPPAWLAAFVHGGRSSPPVSAGRCGPDDVAWAPLGGDLALVLGRHGRPFRARERRQLSALARIAAVRVAELIGRAGELAGT